MNKYHQVVQMYKNNAVRCEYPDARHLPWRDFYVGQVINDAVRSTYVKRIELIDRHQIEWTHYGTDEDIAFHNAGLFYCDTAWVRGRDEYSDNLE